MKTVAYIALLCSLAGASSCQNQSTGVRDSKPVNATIPVDEFEKKLLEKDVQLIDVRTPEEFNQGHLKGALNYDINSSGFQDQLSRLSRDKVVLVYCLSGGRSASAAGLLAAKGFTEIYNMQGGIMKWNAAKKPLDSGTASPAPGGLSVKEFNKLLESDKLVLIDYHAKWCKPCVKMAPMLEAFVDKRKENMMLIKIDADKNKDLLQQQGIESIPVLELYKDGKRIWKHEGEIDEKTLIMETNL